MIPDAIAYSSYSASIVPFMGRIAELATLERQVQQARAGHSEVLMLRGEPGIGKTALLDRAAAGAEGFRIVRVRGVESERELRYAGLQLLCSALPDCLARLSGGQREALDAVIGLGDGPPDRLVLGLATLALLSTAASGPPLLCIIDDVHWLDRQSAEVLAFAFRRLAADALAVLLAAREGVATQELADVRTVHVKALSYAESRALMTSHIRGRVDEAVIGRIIAETRGNPQDLLDVVRGISAADFAGGFGVGVASGCSRGSLEGLIDQLEQLPAESRLVALLAASDPTGDPALQWRAGKQLAIPTNAAARLESDGLVRFGPRVTFDHPAARAALYALASKDDRRLAHRVLADATDSEAAPDRRAWHRALAAYAPDDELAAELELHACAACERGGRSAAAAFLERATMPTLHSGQRVERALAAAAAKFEAGAPDAAARLLVAADVGTLDAARRGRLERQRAQIAFANRRGNDAADSLLKAARRLEVTDLSAARDSYLEALVAAVFAGRLGRGSDTKAVAAAVPAGAPAGAEPAEDLLDALVTRFRTGSLTANQQVRRAIAEMRSVDSHATARWLWLAALAALDVCDDESWQALAAAAHDSALEAGSLTVLPYALTQRAIADLHRGEFKAAATVIADADAVSAGMGTPPLRHAALLLAGWGGHEQSSLALFGAARRDARDRGEGSILTAVSLGEAVLFNGLGRYDAALAAARDAVAHDELGLPGLAMSELIEAAVRCSDLGAAQCTLDALSERAAAFGTDWALGVVARSRALLSEGDTAERLFKQAIERLQQSQVTVHLARAQLVYGEWLRRQGRRIDARPQLRAARDAFAAMGAEAFAERAHREHLATGEKVRRRAVETWGELTPQESRIADLARDGLTNPEIGERLFISARTVEYHLHKVFEKFGITSRRELYLVLEQAAKASPAQRPAERADVLEPLADSEVA
ncbi:MAG TPA: AAA family ATPase [Jatrophihabitans sp.]|nr:AAA family ATPase [Jatrophihabitans sp.]